MTLPTEVKDRIFFPDYKTDEEEYAWKRTDIPVVVKALAEEDLAILGGEAWLVENGVIYGALPSLTYDTYVIYEWHTDKQASETWQQFVRRVAEETLLWFEKYGEDDVPIEKRNFVCYNLTYVTEKEYAELCGKG